MTVDLAVDPVNSNHWFAASATGGIWVTPDAGVTWNPLTDGFDYLGFNSIAVAPSDANTVYAGIGYARAWQASVTSLGGVLVSSNGGNSWILRGTNEFLLSVVGRVLVDPTNSQVVLASITEDIRDYRIYVRRGIYKSKDGGISWTHPVTNNFVPELVANPLDFNQMYCTQDNYDTNGAGLFRSTDRGDHWAKVAVPWPENFSVYSFSRLAIAPSDTNVMYFYEYPTAQIWMTTNAWASSVQWISIPSLPTPNGFGGCLAVDPQDYRVVYAGNLYVYRFESNQWSTISYPVHPDVQRIVFVGQRMIVCTDGGIWSTIDAGGTWLNHNHGGLSITQIYHGAAHPTNQHRALLGAQDNGSSLWVGNSEWQSVFGGDGVSVAFSGQSPDNHRVISLQYGLIFVSTDNTGGNWKDVSPPGESAFGSQFLTLFALSPFNENVMLYAGHEGLLECTNLFSPSPIWFTNGPSLGATWPIPEAIAFDTADPSGQTFLFAGNGNMFLTTNGGLTWKDMHPFQPALFPFTYSAGVFTDLKFDPGNSNVLWAVIRDRHSNVDQPKIYIYRATNALSANVIWSAVPTGIPAGHNCLAFDPLQSGTLYLGTDMGLWMSQDGGTTWAHMGPESGLPNVIVSDLATSAVTGRVLLFTFGRGAFALSRPADRNLSISAIGSNINVQWPVSSVLPDLEFSSDLGAAANWSRVATQPIVVGNQFLFQEPRGLGHRFYRNVEATVSGN